MTLTRARLTELREAVVTGTISWGETAELEDAFAEIPDADLPEPRENATFGDMLDELEARLPLVVVATYADGSRIVRDESGDWQSNIATTLEDTQGRILHRGPEWSCRLVARRRGLVVA